MTTRVIVVTEGDGTFRLITEIGLPIGGRMLTVPPERGKDYPSLQDRYPTKLEAERAALRWNTYLFHARKSRRKSSKRISE